MLPSDPFKNVNRETMYMDLVNEYIDKIPIENEEDFEIVSEALKSLTEPEKDHKVPEKLMGRINSIKKLLESPEIDVASLDKDRSNVKQAILQQITLKIKQLSALPTNEKKQFLADQKLLGEKVGEGMRTQKTDGEASVLQLPAELLAQVFFHLNTQDLEMTSQVGQTWKAFSVDAATRAHTKRLRQLREFLTANLSAYPVLVQQLKSISVDTVAGAQNLQELGMNYKKAQGDIIRLLETIDKPNLQALQRSAAGPGGTQDLAECIGVVIFIRDLSVALAEGDDHALGRTLDQIGKHEGYLENLLQGCLKCTDEVRKFRILMALMQALARRGDAQLAVTAANGFATHPEQKNFCIQQIAAILRANNHEEAARKVEAQA